MASMMSFTLKVTCPYCGVELDVKGSVTQNVYVHGTAPENVVMRLDWAGCQPTAHKCPNLSRAVDA